MFPSDALAQYRAFKEQVVETASEIESSLGEELDTVEYEIWVPGDAYETDPEEFPQQFQADGNAIGGVGRYETDDGDTYEFRFSHLYDRFNVDPELRDIV